MTKPIEITRITTGKDNIIEQLITEAEQSLTPQQAAKIIDKGQDMIHEKTELQSLGDHVRSKPNRTTKDNLVQG
jgi:hypothetical protein